MDTIASDGRLLLGVFAALADFERELIREGTKAALAVRKKQGVIGGRRYRVMPALLIQALTLMDKGGKA